MGRVVDVMSKPEVVDPQGKAVAAALARLTAYGSSPPCWTGFWRHDQ